MNNDITKPITTGATMKATSIWREWAGVFGAVAWMFSMMYGWNMFMNNDLTGSTGGGTYHQTLFMLVLALSILVFSLRFAYDPNRLARLAYYTTPIAITITAVFAMFPTPAASVLYICASILFAPAITRRFYGIVRTSEEGNMQHIWYVSGFILCVFLFVILLLIKPPKEVAFLFLALFSLPAWIGIRRFVPSVQNKMMPRISGFSKMVLPLVAVTIAVLFLLNLLNLVCRYYIVDQGYVNHANMVMAMGLLLPPIGFIVYAFVSDKGYERAGIVCGIGLLLVSVILALLPTGEMEAFIIPLIVVNGVGGAYTQYFFIVIPLYIYRSVKWQTFATSLGVVLFLIQAAIEWQRDAILPEIFRQIGAPLFVSISVTAVLFIVLVFFIFDRHREKTLAAALYALLHSETGVRIKSPVENETTDEPEKKGIIDADFTSEELDVAMLLIEGVTQRDIARKLHINADAVGQHEKSIRQKLHLLGDPDPVIAAVVQEYKLTKRETDILKLLQNGETTEKVASELYITEGTVRVHVTNLLKKLDIERRQGITEWLDKRRYEYSRQD